MFEGRRELLVLAFLACGFLAVAVQANSSVFQIGTIIYSKEKTLIDMFSPEERNRLESLIEEQWLSHGVTNAVVRICNGAQSTPKCDIGIRPTHILEMRINTVRLGTPTSGIAISLEMSDPRQSHENKIEVLPIQCVLRDRATQQPIDVQNVEQPAPVIESVKREKLIQHFSRLFFISCADIVMDSDWNGIVDTSARRQFPILSAYPDVVIEKHVGRSDTSHGGNRAGTGAGPTTADESPTGAGEDGEASRYTVDNDKRRMQYIIHNPASTVILEFGHRRE